jgi:hypothetical protein
MFKARTISLLLLMALIALEGVRAEGQPVPSNAEAASSQENTKKELDEICSKTQDAMVLSSEELTALIARCDALVPKIEKLDDTQKRVYMKRLVQCRGLYAYVLDSKGKEKK